jgi:hypothetical protein
MPLAKSKPRRWRSHSENTDRAGIRRHQIRVKQRADVASPEDHGPRTTEREGKLTIRSILRRPITRPRRPRTPPSCLQLILHRSTRVPRSPVPASRLACRRRCSYGDCESDPHPVGVAGVVAADLSSMIGDDSLGNVEVSHIAIDATRGERRHHREGHFVSCYSCIINPT